MSKTLIIVPCYNEKDNIIKLINTLFSASPESDIIIVDDSNDDTANLVKDSQLTHQNLFLIKRLGKGGRGTAVLDGLKFGLKNGYEYMIEMDADLSHDPKELPCLIELAGANTVVIGSRYLKGSKIVGWPLRRKIFSWLANLYAGFILQIKIHDYTNGYRVYSRDAVEKINFNEIKSTGYVVLSEIAYQLFLKGVKFKEFPIVFVNRREGSSNFSLKEIKEAFTSVIRVKMNYRK